MIDLPNYLDVTTDYDNKKEWYLCTINARYPYNFTFHGKTYTRLYVTAREEEIISKLQQTIDLIDLETKK